LALLDAFGAVMRRRRVVGTDKASELRFGRLVSSTRTVFARLRDDVEKRSSRTRHWHATAP